MPLFIDDRFDLVVSIQVFSHLPGWEAAKQAFAECARVLKPGGIFYLRVGSTTRPLPEDAVPVEDNGDVPTDQAGVTYTSNRHGDLLTYRRYSLGELEWLARHNGLEIVGTPLDEKDRKDGVSIIGHWNAVFRKTA